MKHLISIAICSLFACGDSPSSGGSDPADLVGTWREIPSSFDGDTPIDQRSRITLGDDGSYRVEEPSHNSDESGTFVANSDTITLTGTEDGKTSKFVDNYVVTGDRFLLGALFPQGTVDGVVGTWKGNVTLDTDTITLTLDLHADNTAHYDRKGSKPADNDVRDGTWKFEGDDVVTSFVNGGTTVNIHMQQLDGRALGGPLYERL